MAEVRLECDDYPHTVVFLCNVQEILQFREDFRSKSWDLSPLELFSLVPFFMSIERVEVRFKCKKAAGATQLAKRLQGLLDKLRKRR